ncbi:uncharacterized protein [Rutidosis leptorrhynchoides]|uniref:uncharacterized protein n=1 Tax=Rutidosis leptorrhynchoides TaxID=125765 RepID=UPI003A99CBC3
MDLHTFKLDTDEIIREFAEDEMTTLSHMKRIWLSKKFTCIFEAKPNTKLGFFMQSLYGNCMGYMTSSASISHRLGGLYCLYFLHETQPFNPPFRIYISSCFVLINGLGTGLNRLTQNSEMPCTRFFE